MPSMTQITHVHRDNTRLPMHTVNPHRYLRLDFRKTASDLDIPGYTAYGGTLSHRPVRAWRSAQAVSPSLFSAATGHSRTPALSRWPGPFLELSVPLSLFPAGTSAGHLAPVTVHLCRANVFPRGWVGPAPSHVGPSV